MSEIRRGNLTELHLPGVKTVGDYFFSENNFLQHLSMPDLEQLG